MLNSIDISPSAVLEAKMRALETQFKLPLFNPGAVELRRQTEVALGDVYLEIMGKEATKLDYFSTQKI